MSAYTSQLNRFTLSSYSNAFTVQQSASSLRNFVLTPSNHSSSFFFLVFLMSFLLAAFFFFPAWLASFLSLVLLESWNRQHTEWSATQSCGC